MTRWIAALALILTAGSTAALAQVAPAADDQPAAAQPQGAHAPDAVAVNDVAAALKEGFSASIRTYLDSQSALVGMFPSTEGRWAQKALTDDGQWAARHTGTGTVSQGKDPVDFDALWLPDQEKWIDHETSTVYARPIKSRNKPGASHQLANTPMDRIEPLMSGFAEPLKSAASIELREPAEIDGVQCDVVAISQQAGGDPVIWYFGAEDHLPRRAEILLPDNPMLSGAMRVDFTDPVAGARASEFEMYTPEGYTEDTARALGGQGPEVGNRPGQGTGLITPAPGSEPAPALPEWEVADTEGRLISPSSLKGKVAVLYFWGTWSAPAKKATPGVAALVKDYEDKGVEVISMAFRESDAGAVAAAAAEQGQTWRQVPEADDAAKLLNVRLAPSFVVLGKEGELLFKSGRPSNDYTETFTRMRAIIDQALTAEPTPTTESKARPAAAEGREMRAGEQTRATRPTRVIRKKD